MSRRNGRNRTPPNIESMVSLKVDNLSYRTTVEDLKRYFSRYGEVGDIYIPRNPFTMASRGFAFVRYYNEREAEKAIDNLNGKTIDGRDIRICHAKYNRPGSAERKNRYKSPRRQRYSTSISKSRSRSRSRSRRRSKRKSRRRSYSNSRSRSVSRRSRSRSRSRKSYSRSRTRSRRSRSRRSRSRSSRSRSRSRRSSSRGSRRRSRSRS